LRSRVRSVFTYEGRGSCGCARFTCCVRAPGLNGPIPSRSGRPRPHPAPPPPGTLPTPAPPGRPWPGFAAIQSLTGGACEVPRPATGGAYDYQTSSDTPALVRRWRTLPWLDGRRRAKPKELVVSPRQGVTPTSSHHQSQSPICGPAESMPWLQQTAAAREPIDRGQSPRPAGIPAASLGFLFCESSLFPQMVSRRIDFAGAGAQNARQRKGKPGRRRNP
jgi:hypothetical protein